MSKRQTVLFLVAALILTLIGILWGMRTKAEAGSYTTNIPDYFNVPVYRADCATEYGCWRLVSAIYEDETQSGGLHHIFAMEPHDALEFMEVCVEGGECYRVPLDKPYGEPAGNFAMFAGARHCAKLVGAPSDEICNLRMRGPTPDTEYQAHHINYKLTWEWRREIPLAFSVYLPLVSKP